MEHTIPKRKADSSGLKDLRSKRSRAGLREALCALLQAEPWDRISVRDIAAKAGVGYTTYFRHYANKDALLDDLAAEEITALTALTLPVYNSVDSLAACTTLCSYVDSRRALWAALLTGGAAGAVREELIRQGRISSAGKQGGSWLPAELQIALTVSGMAELLAWWLRQTDPLPAEKVAEMMDQIITPAEPRRAKDATI